MSFRNAWVISQKEFSIIKLRKTLIYFYVVLPLALSIGLPLLIWHVINGQSIRATDIHYITGLMEAFEFFFVIIAVVLSSYTAAYSIVGEKIQKSLESLLSTPISDGEIILGKSISAFIPSFLAVLLGNSIYMLLMDKVTYHLLGYSYYPTLSTAIVLILLVPLGIILSIEISTMSSSRVSDPRSAYQLSMAAFIPFFIVYLLTEFSMISLTSTTLLIISVIVAAVDLLMYPLVIRIFSREMILTSWK
ncbi:MAG: ABC transporter permease [Thermoplasmatales archaeon]